MGYWKLFLPKGSAFYDRLTIPRVLKTFIFRPHKSVVLICEMVTKCPARFVRLKKMNVIMGYCTSMLSTMTIQKQLKTVFIFQHKPRSIPIGLCDWKEKRTIYQPGSSTS